ncbi:isochorismate synthase [Halorhodospira abdelmalekii]|uniref:isochorismate synthase n=1 Tax=Halorhodospira abdelmalekii TaxID=421629 RepID=UPI001907EC97|nr:chorismate-binding protein [Halorhodospira abdelmalekii]
MLEQVREWELAPGELQRLVVPVAEADPVAWLHVNPWAERSYWSDRDQRLEIGGIGQAVCLSASTSAEYPQLLERAHALASAADAGLLCAFAFDEAPGRDHWHGFPAAVALLPAIELRREHRQLQLAVNLYAESAAEFVRHKTRLIELLGRLQAPPACISAEQSAGVQVLLRRDELDYAACKAHILAILDEIEAGGIHKAVLARQVELQLAEELPAFATLARWQRISPGSFSFAIEYAGRLFMGCSPERLFRREGQEVLTESLAGTVRRGDTLEEDRSLEAALRNDAKLVREHDWVTRYIEGELTPWVTRTEAPAQAGVLKLDRIQHRHLPIRATLKEGVGDLELLQALHPTPAVCGFPRREAHELIARHERVQRGWYSGAIGVIAPRVSELAVAIRSVLVAGDRAWCYSGVGIVEGSDPEVEWQELEAKIESFLAAVKG